MPKKTARPQHRRHRKSRMGEITREDSRRINCGLLLYSTNARAASRTLKGLGKDSEAEQLDAEAADIEQRLLPKFTDRVATEVAHA